MSLDALALLRAAVAVASPSGAEAEVARVLVEAMRAGGLDARVDEAGNAVGRWGRGDRLVTVLGHIDTAPGLVPVREDGGALYGRGSVDAKGSFCAAVAAVARLGPDAGERLRLLLVGAVEEEAPTSKGARHALTSYERPDLLVIGEPSGWDAYTLGYKGRLLLRLEADLPSAHSARDDATAAELVVEAHRRLAAFVARENVEAHGAFDSLQLSLQAIDSDHDGLRQRCRAVLGFRLPPRWDPVELERALAALELPPGVTRHGTGHERAHRAERDSELARAFRVAIRAVGGRPRSKVKTGTSDMNVVAPTWDVPMLAYGPGDAALDHTPDEHLDLAEYERSVQVWSHALSVLAGDR